MRRLALLAAFLLAATSAPAQDSFPDWNSVLWSCDIRPLGHDAYLSLFQSPPSCWVWARGGSGWDSFPATIDPVTGFLIVDAGDDNRFPDRPAVLYVKWWIPGPWNRGVYTGGGIFDPTTMRFDDYTEAYEWGGQDSPTSPPYEL
jgi:hypothetical protein